MSDSIRFFCIRGYMKSGTNWMCRLLNLHADVHCIGEFHWETFYRALNENVQRIAPKRRDQLSGVLNSELQKMIRSSLIQLSGKSALIIGDRTPTTIEPVVLPVPHIVMIRDFRDVIVSRMFHLFNNPRVTGIFKNNDAMAQRLEQFQQDPWFFNKHPEQLLDCEEIVRDSAREWSQHLSSDRATVAQFPDLPVLFVRYEDLHSSFDSKLADVFEFLDLEAPLTVADELKPGHADENPNALNRKGQIGDWKNYLNERVLDWIEQEAGAELERYNGSD